MVRFITRWLAIRKAMTCKGWTSRAKLLLLYDIAKRAGHVPGDILEIGSAWGRSTVLLCLASEKKVWSIDPHTGGLLHIKKGTDQGSYGEFMANLVRFGLAGRVGVMKATTQAAFDDGPAGENSYSVVFIDGLHTADGVTTDFGRSYPRLADGGYMVFDDYFEETVKDYSAAIDGLVAGCGAELTKDMASRLVYFRKEASG